MYEEYYEEPKYYREPKHSGFGIASFVMTLATGVLAFVTVVIAGILENSTPGGIDEDSPILMVVGLAMIGCLLLNLLGIIFGIVGLFQQNRKKVFALLGVVIGCLAIVGFLLLFAVGIAMG